MITVDSRAGSGDMVSLFPPGIEVCVSTLDYGDFFFLGNGEDQSLVSVGIERKAIRDLVDSIATGRFSGHQLPGLLTQYNYVYLLVEGLWRYDQDSGILQVMVGSFWTDLCLGSRRFMAKEIVGFLNTIQIKAGVYVMYTGSRKETVQTVCSLYHWWNDKQFDSHTAHLSPHKVHRGPQGEISLIKPSLVRRVAAELKGVGWSKSKAVEDRFESVEEMVNASEKEWRKVDGIGPIIASSAWGELHAKKT